MLEFFSCSWAHGVSMQFRQKRNEYNEWSNFISLSLFHFCFTLLSGVEWTDKYTKYKPHNCSQYLTKRLISDQHIFGNMPFAELMQYIIDYKRTGRWPFEGMSKNKKSEFRRKSRQFRLMDNGDLMRVVFKEGVPTGVYFFHCGVNFVSLSWHSCRARINPNSSRTP